MQKKAVIIGSGFAGLAAACFMAKAGWSVTVIEKNATAGGRAAQLSEHGYTFDKGPSFYWMPDVFERFFSQFNTTVADQYELTRLDPSYRIYWSDAFTDIPASYASIRTIFESLEPGSGARLDEFLKGAAYKYHVGMGKLVYKPGRSVSEFMDWQTISGVAKLQVFTSMHKHIRKYFKHPKLIQLLEFPVLFLGALPKDTPALYSLMNYADLHEGTWYPKGGMYAVVDAMKRVAEKWGVQFRFNENVLSINVKDSVAQSVTTGQGTYQADAVINGADYHFTEMSLLPEKYRTYKKSYWDKKVMAPSCLLYYVGLNKKLKQGTHHMLFFDVSFDQHGREIYRDPKWPTDPLFYVSVPSVTEPGLAPEGHETLVFLIPVAAGLENDTEDLRKMYFDKIVKRFEEKSGERISDSISYYKSYAVSDFVHDYNSFRGNAYGLANTLRQTAIFRPTCKSKKVKNLFFTGQLTVPGPGVPPSLVSGEVVAKQVLSSVQ